MAGIKEHSPNATMSVAIPLKKGSKPKVRLDLSNFVNTQDFQDHTKNHGTMINLGGQYDFDSGAFGYNAGLGYTQGGQGPTGEIGSKQYFLNFHNFHRPNFQLPKLEIDKTITAAPQVSWSSEETRPLLTYNYLDYSK